MRQGITTDRGGQREGGQGTEDIGMMQSNNEKERGAEEKEEEEEEVEEK